MYQLANFAGLNDFISKSSSEFSESNAEANSVDQNWNSFKHSEISGISKFIPQKPPKPRNKLPWISHEIKRQIRKKDRLHKKAIRSKNPQHWKALKSQRNLVSSLIKKSHHCYLNEAIGGSLIYNPKEFRSYVKHSKSENIDIPPLKSGDCISTNDKDKAETLNSYFLSRF